MFLIILNDQNDIKVASMDENMTSICLLKAGARITPVSRSVLLTKEVKQTRILTHYSSFSKQALISFL